MPHRRIPHGCSIVSALAFCLLFAGCRSEPEARRTAAQGEAEQVKIVRALPVAGPWSAAEGGVRSRVLLDREAAKETETVRAALALHNPTRRPITLSAAGAISLGAENVAWRVGDVTVREPSHGTVTSGAATLELAPGRTYITEPVELAIPPGEGTKEVSATLALDHQKLAPPAVAVAVSAAEWGPVSNGLRMRLSADRASYEVGQTPVLRIHVHNTTGEPVRFYPPDWETLDTDTRRDRLTFIAKAKPFDSVRIEPGAAWSGQVPEPPLLAPVKYVTQFVLNAPELSITYGRAWSGKLASNEVTLEVREGSAKQ